MGSTLEELEKLAAGREITLAQLVIKINEYADDVKASKASIARKFGINKRMLTYASEIREVLPVAYNDLKRKGETTADGKCTKSLEKVYRSLSRKIDYIKLLKSEKGKREFIDRYEENTNIPIDDKMFIIELLNYKYPIDTKKEDSDGSESK